MEKTKKSGLTKLYFIIQRVNEQRHLYSIRTTFISIMPIMIAGAFAVVINQMPIPAYQDLMTGLLGDSWKLFGELIFNCTTQIVSLLVIFGINSNLAGWYNIQLHRQVHPGICGMVGLASYLLVSISLQQPGDILTVADSTGLFVAMFVAVLSAEIFIALCNKTKNRKVLSDDPNPMVSQSFSAVLPAIFTIILFALIRVIMVSFGVRDGFSDLMYQWLSRPFVGSTETIGTAQAFNLSTHVMWLFGIHGNNVLDEVAKNTFVPAMEQNIAAYAQGLAAPNLITKTLFDVFVYMGGAGTTLGLLLALIFFGKARSYRLLLRYALPTSVFNINEPLVFGIPIVLNPIFAIPFVLAPVVSLSTTVLAMKFGLVPYTIADVPWTTPVFISGYIATGSIAGVVLQAVNLALAMLLYAPFVRISESIMQMRFDRVYGQLCHIVCTHYSPSQKLIERPDEIGAVARRLANQLESAISSGEVQLDYQPIVDARFNHLHSVEALFRWNHPQHGMINPLVAIFLSEETGKIHKLGLWVLEESIRQRQQWTRQGLPDFHVSVNISALQLDNPHFHEQVASLLQKYGVPANQLQIEITETAALLENAITRDNLKNLREMGISLAMDDFGVGHSSLLYLRTNSITTLKIDGVLSRGIEENSANLDIISTIHELCEHLSIITIVEYVETKEQLDCLLGVGAYLIQGYYFSPALHSEEIEGFMKQLEAKEIA